MYVNVQSVMGCVVVVPWYYKDGGGKVFEFAKKGSQQQILWSEKMKNSKKL